MTRINDVLSPSAKADLKRKIETFYVRDADEAIASRDGWRSASDIAETSAKVLAGVTSVLSFAASTYKSPSISFAAGVVGTSGVVLAGFSSYAAKESRERLMRLNAILTDVNIREVHIDPSTDVDAENPPQDN